MKADNDRKGQPTSNASSRLFDGLSVGVAVGSFAVAGAVIGPAIIPPAIEFAKRNPQVVQEVMAEVEAMATGNPAGASSTSTNTIVMEGVEVTAGAGAKVANLTDDQVKTIANFAKKNNTEVTVVGSRAAGTAKPTSDFDFVIGGTSKIRKDARKQLPRGSAGGEIDPRTGRETGIDIFNPKKDGPVKTDKPFITFGPKKQQ